MARIPEHEVTRLKQDISLQQLVETHGLILKPHGHDLLGQCPFHDDSTPSLVISPQKNLWHCLGACQMGGSVIDWVMKVEGVSFRHAVELLRAGVSSPPNPQPVANGQQPLGVVKRSRVQKLPTTLPQSVADAQLLQDVVVYYHQTLKDSPEALAYLTQRGLTDSEMLAHFQLGFANRTLGYRLPNKALVAGAALRGQLQRIGLMRPSGHEHFNGSVMIPIFDAQGQVREELYSKVVFRVS